MSEQKTGDPNLDALTLQDCTRLRQFLVKLTDPEGFGFAVNGDVRREAFDLLTMDIFK